MHGSMMDYPLTLDRILAHARRMFPHKRILTRLPAGAMHEYTYADLAARSARLANVLVSLGIEPGDPRGHVRVEQLPAPGAVLRYSAGGRGLPHAEHPPAFRPAGLHRPARPRTGSSSSTGACCRSSRRSCPR